MRKSQEGGAKMPKGVYERERIPVHRFSITFHERDWPMVESAARQARMSVASFVRDCVFKVMDRPEHKRKTDQALAMEGTTTTLKRRRRA